MTVHLPLVRPQTFDQCAALGAPAPVTRVRAASEDEVAEPDEDREESLFDDDELDERADAAAEELRAEGGVPCPFVGCSDHLVWVALGVADPRKLSEHELSAVVHQLDAIDLDALPVTCARRGPFTLDQIGALLGVTRERIRQIETKALKKLRHPARSKDISPYREEGEGVERPDLVERPGHDAFGARAIQEAARRLVPQLAKSFEESSARVRRANKTPGAKCSVEGCPNMLPRGRRPRDGELVGRCRAHRDEIAPKAEPTTRVRVAITVRGKTLSKSDWARKLDLTVTRITQLEQAALARGETLAQVIERRLVALETGVPVAPAPRRTTRDELVTVGDESLSRAQWAARLGVKKQRLSQLETRARSRGKTLIDVITERLALAAAAQPAPTDTIADAPAPADDTTEDHVHEATIETPSPAPEEPAPVAVAKEPTPEQRRAAELFAAQSAYIHGLGPKPTPRSIANVDPQSQHAPEQRPTVKRVVSSPKRVTKRHARAAERTSPSVSQIVRDAARGFDEIVRAVGRGRR